MIRGWFLVAVTQPGSFPVTSTSRTGHLLPMAQQSEHSKSMADPSRPPRAVAQQEGEQGLGWAACRGLFFLRGDEAAVHEADRCPALPDQCRLPRTETGAGSAAFPWRCGRATAKCGVPCGQGSPFQVLLRCFASPLQRHCNLESGQQKRPKNAALSLAFQPPDPSAQPQILKQH